MRTGLNLRPGERGTRRLTAQYGDRLVCVRYRYDEVRKKRFKTVELIVDEKPWQPPAKGIHKQAIVEVRIAPSERELLNRVQQAGGRWNPDKRLWELRYESVVQLRLKGRMVKTRSASKW